MPLTAFLCDSGLFGGWPSAFYIIGLFGCLWFIMWSTLVTDSPLTHPLISKEELRYITSNQKVNHTVKAPPVPWKKIMLSVPFWIVVLCKTCQDWSFYTMMTDLPTFFGTVLHFPIQENGFFSSLPHVIQTIVGIIVSFVADFLIRRGIFFSHFCKEILQFCVRIWRCSWLSGCLSGRMRLVGALTEEQNTLHQWRIVFIITSVLLVIASFAFIFFSSSEKQDWSDPISSEVILDLPEETKKRKTI
ncbi:vesicular glutamate transporter 3 [Caerostris extrusa]|uniref:Vesicular glutamate transporter 3 n=1 Tax=Caerostris extrusa TaxID=172846 RepID=A0AAV4Q540_CAEEX|nr:vesicular glutamate transporter 3 [Caerostris extrusa]